MTQTFPGERGAGQVRAPVSAGGRLTSPLPLPAPPSCASTVPSPAMRAGLEAITACGLSRNILLSCSLNFDLLFNFHSSGKLGDKKDAPMLSAREEGCER